MNEHLENFLLVVGTFTVVLIAIALLTRLIIAILAAVSFRVDARYKELQELLKERDDEG